jgi:hypothetical protein
MSDTASQRSAGSKTSKTSASIIRAPYAIGTGTALDIDNADNESDVFTLSTALTRGAMDTGAQPDEYVFKVADVAGNTHRVKASRNSLQELKGAVAETLKCDPNSVMLSYVDDDKDTVLISGDGALRDAVDMACAAGSKSLKLTMAVGGGAAPPAAPGAPSMPAMVGAAGGVVAVMATALFIFMRRK